MKNSYKLGLASIVASMALVGCGGGSTTTPETVSGKFIDAAVAGLNYTCSSGKTDITNGEGQYTCNVGDKVKFSLGGYSIGGEVDASSGIVTPTTIWPNDADAALNVAQLIQTVTTTDTAGNLVVPENFTDLDNSTVKITATDFDTEIVKDLTDYSQLVSEADAQAHLDKSAVLVFIAGNTFYLFDQGMERLDFSADGSSVTMTDLVDGDSASMSITISGDTITAEDGTTVRVDLTTETTDTITVFSDEGQGEVEEIWYLNQEDRLRDLLANSTWVSAETTLTFNADVTSVTVEDADGTFNDSITLDGMVITHTEGTEVIMILDDTTLIFNPGAQNEEVFNLEGATATTSTGTSTTPPPTWYISDPTITDPAAATTLESSVSGNVLVFDSPNGQLTATFAVDGSYTEVNPGGTCSGKWAVIGDNFIGTTCKTPASTVTPTSTTDSDMIIAIWGDPTNLTDIINKNYFGSTLYWPNDAIDSALISVTPL